MFGDFGVAQIATGFEGKVVNSLADHPMTNVQREPSKAGAQAGLQQISSILGAQLEWTPFTGKYSLFGKLFSAYDFYLVLPGVAFMNVKPGGSSGAHLRPGRARRTRRIRTNTSAPSREPRSAARSASASTRSSARRSPSASSSPTSSRSSIRRAATSTATSSPNNDDLSWTNTFLLTANLTVYFPSAKISP